MILRELINKIGFKVDEKAFNDAEKKFVDLANKAKFLSAGAGAAAAGLFGVSVKAGQAADQLLDLKQITGASTDTLQEMKYIAADAGVSFEGLTGIYSKFTNLLPSIQKGTSDSAKAFDQLGVSLKDSNGDFRSTDELVPELIMKLQNVTNVTERNALAQKIFGRDLSALGPVLGYTNDQFKALSKEAHEMGTVLSEDAIKDANAFRAVMDKGSVAIKAGIYRLGASFAPVFEGMILPMFNKGIQRMNAFMTWFDKLNKGVKVGIMVFLGLTAAIAPTLLIIAQVLKAVRMILPLLKAVKAAVIAVNAAMAANPIILIIAGVTALIAVLVLLIVKFKDVKAWGQRVAASLAQFFSQAAELIGLAGVVAVKQLLLWFLMFWDWFSGRFPGLANVVGETFSFIKDQTGNMVGFWKNLFQGLFALFTGDVDSFKNHFIFAFGSLGEFFTRIIGLMGLDIDKLWSWIQPIYDFLTGLFSGAIDRLINGVDKVVDFFDFDGDPEGPKPSPGGPGAGGVGIIRPAAVSSNSRSININSSISLAVPEGTPQHQRQSLQDTAERAARAVFEREMRGLSANAAGGEVR